MLQMQKIDIAALEKSRRRLGDTLHFREHTSARKAPQKRSTIAAAHRSGNIEA